MGKFEFEANVQFPFSQFKYFCFRQYDRKCLFNVRHSHARVRMTENIYEILKRRFPISKYIRCYVPNAVRIVQACAVLNNMAIVWRDAEPALIRITRILEQKVVWINPVMIKWIYYSSRTS